MAGGTWVTCGVAIIYGIVRLVPNKKASWVPLAGLGVSSIWIYLIATTHTNFPFFPTD